MGLGYRGKSGHERTSIGGETVLEEGTGKRGGRQGQAQGMGTASTGVDGRKGSVWLRVLGRKGVEGDRILIFNLI